MDRRLKEFLPNSHTACEMTHLLKELGESDMQKGIKKVWTDGYNHGIGSGLAYSAIIGIAGFSIYKIKKYMTRRRDMIGETFCSENAVVENVNIDNNLDNCEL